MNITLNTLITHYTERRQRIRLSPESISTDQRILNRFAATVGAETTIKSLTEEAVNGFVAGRQAVKVKWLNHPLNPAVAGKLSPFTIRKEVRVLRTFGNWLDTEGYPNPFSRLEIPKTPKRIIEILTDAEIERMLACANIKSAQGARLYAMLALMLDTGLRASEVTGAKLEHLDIEHRRMKVLGKGDKERYVPFGLRVAQALARYVTLWRPKPVSDDNVFLALDGFPLTRKALIGIFTVLKKSAKTPRLHAHLLRHTFAVNYLVNGGDVMSLKEIMGHESIETTQLYIHLSRQMVQAKHEEFSPMDRMALHGERRFGRRRTNPPEEGGR